MQIKKNIYLIIGITLIILNLLVDIVEFAEHNNSSSDVAYSIGYFIGSHFLLIFGIIFLRLAYKIHKKMKGRELMEMVEDIGKP